VKWTEEEYLNARFRASRPKYSPTSYQEWEKVAKTALRVERFAPTLARFPGTCGIFSSAGDSKLTPDSLGSQWNGQRKNIWTRGFELLGRNIVPLHFKEKVAETAWRAGRFSPTLGRFPGTCVIFFSPGDSKLTRDVLCFQWNGQRKNIWTLGFELLGWNIASLHFETDRVAETA